MTYADIIKKINNDLKSAYPEITRYGNDVTDSVTRPYFFVELVPTQNQNISKTMRNVACTVYITYRQLIQNQLDNLEKVEKLRELFDLNIKVNERKLTIGNFSHKYIGKTNDILQITFDLEWVDFVDRTEKYDLIKECKTKIEGGNT